MLARVGVVPVLLLLASIALAGCASAPASSYREAPSTTPRVRCLSDPREQDTRPLFFLFCVQSP